MSFFRANLHQNPGRNMKLPKEKNFRGPDRGRYDLIDGGPSGMPWEKKGIGFSLEA